MTINSSNPLHNQEPQQSANIGTLWKVVSRPVVWIPAGLITLLVIGGGVIYGQFAGWPGPESAEPDNQLVVEADNQGNSKPNTASNVNEDGTPVDESESQQNTTNKKSATTSTSKTKSNNQASGGSNSSPTKPTNPQQDDEDDPTPPSEWVKPNSTNTGPRYPIERTLTATEALAELRSTGYLSRVKITNTFRLSGSDGRNWVIEDSIFETGSIYGIQSYSSLTSFTGTYAERPIFRYVEIAGRGSKGTGSTCAANVYGGNIILQNVDIYGCQDGIKPSSHVDIISSWIHDNDYPEGTHCDSIQITQGSNIFVRGSRIDAYVGYSSDGSVVADGRTCNAALQTGTATGNISATFENNWFAGGHYTIRGWSASDETKGSMSFTFRNNKWMRNGTSVTLGLTNLQSNQYGATTGRLGTFDKPTNVWEDTGLPVNS